jgi:hypothetical protein
MAKLKKLKAVVDFYQLPADAIITGRAMKVEESDFPQMQPDELVMAFRFSNKTVASVIEKIQKKRSIARILVQKIRFAEPMTRKKARRS